MRRVQLAVILIVLLIATGLSLASEGTDYGEGLTGKKTIKISKLLSEPDPHVGETVRVKGVVTGVCEKRGCWMSLASDVEFEELRIKVDDGVIVFPMSAKGKKAIAEGVFTKIEMSLEQTVAYKQHHAEEHGEEFDAASVTEPMTYYQIKATGARVF